MAEVLALTDGEGPDVSMRQPGAEATASLDGQNDEDQGADRGSWVRWGSSARGPVANQFYRADHAGPAYNYQGFPAGHWSF